MITVDPGPTGAGGRNAVDHIQAGVVLAAVALHLRSHLTFFEDALAGDLAAVLLGGQVVLVAAGTHRIVAEHARRKGGELEDVAVERRHVLDLVAGDGAADVRGGGVQRWHRTAVDRHSLSRVAYIQLHVDRIRLLRNDRHIVQRLAGKVLGGDREAEGVGGQGLKLVKALAVALRRPLEVRAQIGERKRGAGDDCPLRIGHGALDGCPILCLRQRREQQQDRDGTQFRQRKAVDGRREPAVCDVRHFPTP